MQIRRRGRPRKEDILAREARKPKQKTDEETLADIIERFAMLGKLTHAAVDGNIRAMVISGGPGVGKTYNVERILEGHPTAQCEFVKGSLSAVELYKLGFRNRRRGAVVVLDDADGIFADEDALNVLKALCDSSQTRRVSWLKDSNTLKEDDVPQTYEFNGSFIFISNLPFQDIIDDGGNKYVPHFEALLSRALFLDLRIFSPQALSLWVRHVATTGKMLEREGIDAKTGADILKFVVDHRDDLREISLRTVVKLCDLARSYPSEWNRMGVVTLCRTN